MIFLFFGVIFVLLKGDFLFLFLLYFNSGDLWMIVVVCIWGIYFVCSKWVIKIIILFMVMLYFGIFGVILLLLFNIGSFIVLNINIFFIILFLYIGFILIVFCMVFWNIGV